MNNLLNTAVAGIVVVFVAFFGANAAHAAGCSNQTIHVDGELVYVSSKCTWNDAPASQDLLDQMTWGANLADSDNGPKADVVEATEEVVVGGGEEQIVVGNKLTKKERKQNRRIRAKIKDLKADRAIAKQARKDATNKVDRKAAKRSIKKLNRKINKKRSKINRK